MLPRKKIFGDFFRRKISFYVTPQKTFSDLSSALPPAVVLILAAIPNTLKQGGAVWHAEPKSQKAKSKEPIAQQPEADLLRSS